MRTVTERFRCIHPTVLFTDDDYKLHAQAQDLIMTYNQDQYADFTQQLLAIRIYHDV